ncbi:TRAP transporter large permease [Celeribacter sp.]|uniref:TRAP transporter large permease n=1 Tax=Celeribacter sp. TaxID=1890673 RepID=UPI003A92EF26
MLLLLSAVIFIVFGAIGIPVALTFLAIIGTFVIAEPAVLDVVAAQRLISGTQSFPLLAVPLFILTGELMNISGITPRVTNFALVLTRGVSGGLAKTNVVLSTLLSGMSGSANGDAAMQAKILVPQMVKNGYPAPFSAAVTAASALIAPLIPPGIGLILFGFVTNTSIGALFAGAILPGVLLSAALLVLVHFLSKRNGWGEPSSEHDASMSLGTAFIQSLPAIMMPILIVVGIRGGVFTPSEAGGLAVGYTLIFMVVYREATWADLIRALWSTVATSSAIILVLATSAALTWILTFNQVPQAIGEFLVGLTTNKTMMLIIVSLVLLIAGMLIEGTALILVLGPMLMPVALTLGINPVHFGIVFVFMIHMGGITPPVGTVMFTTCSATGVSIGEFAKAIIPFLLVFLLVAITLILVPQVSTLLTGV